MRSVVIDAVADTVLRVWQLTREHARGPFQDAALALLRQRLSFDGALWGYATVAGTVLDVHAVHLVDVPPQAMDEYACVRSWDPVVQRAVREPGRSAVYDARRPPGRTDPRWTDFQRRWQVHAVSTVMLVQVHAKLAMFTSFYRKEASGEFTEDERRLHEAVAPHLQEAYEAALLHGMERSHGRIMPGAPAGLADRRGRLHLAEGGFEVLLHREWPGWEGPDLPWELASLAASGRTFRGKAIVVAAGAPIDGFASLRARARAPADGLSPRELQIAMGWAQGRESSEIAGTLGLSTTTVRNRLRDVYGKLGVGDRIAVQQALRAIGALREVTASPEDTGGAP